VAKLAVALQEEELRACADPKYQHLHEDLHVEITAFAPPAEAHARIAYALTEVRKYLIPDSNDEIRQEQMREMELLAVGGCGPEAIAAAATNNNVGVQNGCFDPLKRALSAYAQAAAAAAANGMYPNGTAPANPSGVPPSSVQCAAPALPVQSLQSLQSQYSAAMLRAAAATGTAGPGLSMQTISAAPYLSASPIVMRQTQREDIPKDG
jgi:hypothetical protein